METRPIQLAQASCSLLAQPLPRVSIMRYLLFFFCLSSSGLHADWRADADLRIEKIRKGDFFVHLVPPPPAGTKIDIRLIRHDFLFGTAVAEPRLQQTSLDGVLYRKFITDHFNSLVAENSMKWYAIEKERGVLDFEQADALVSFAKEHQMPLRGHCLFWSKTKFVQPWVQELDPPALDGALKDHLRQLVTRYKNDVICWDVNNEMLDGQFYQERLGRTIHAEMFRQAHEGAPDLPLFVNEYGILDSDEKMTRLIDLIRQLQKQGAPVGGIGIQEHATERFVPAKKGPADSNPERSGAAPLLPEEVWKRLDSLGKLGLPIHLTEVSAKTNDEQRRAESLEMLYRVAFAHPDVDAIFLWGFWEKAHWLGKEAALIDKDWQLLPSGKRLTTLLKEEWQTKTQVPVDQKGRVQFRGFYGRYSLTWTGPDGVQEEATFNFPRPRPKK